MRECTKHVGGQHVSGLFFNGGGIWGRTIHCLIYGLCGLLQSAEVVFVGSLEQLYRICILLDFVGCCFGLGWTRPLVWSCWQLRRCRSTTSSVRLHRCWDVWEAKSFVGTKSDEVQSKKKPLVHPQAKDSWGWSPPYCNPFQGFFRYHGTRLYDFDPWPFDLLPSPILGPIWAQ